MAKLFYLLLVHLIVLLSKHHSFEQVRAGPSVIAFWNVYFNCFSLYSAESLKVEYSPYWLFRLFVLVGSLSTKVNQLDLAATHLLFSVRTTIHFKVVNPPCLLFCLFWLVLSPQWWTSTCLLFCLFWLVLSPQWWTSTSWQPLLRWSCVRTTRHPRVGTVWQRTPPSVMTQPTNASSVRAPATHAVRVNLLTDELLFLRYSLNMSLSGF